MWSETTRKQDERRAGRYASDLTDGEWALMASTLRELGFEVIERLDVGRIDLESLGALTGLSPISS